MKNLKIAIPILTFCLISHAGKILANGPDQFIDSQNLYSLDIWEMRQITVVSKKAETIQEAPGIVTVVTADDIKRFGARNLVDVLDRLPNMLVLGTSDFPNGRVMMRGVNSTQQDDDILLLLDGMPLRDTGTGGHNTDIYQLLPIEIIERIEIIRGPGSVLYGPNAFAGIVNIKTKRFSAEEKMAVAVKYGSFNRRQKTLTGGLEQGDAWFTGSVTALDDHGDRFPGLFTESESEMLPPPMGGAMGPPPMGGGIGPPPISEAGEFRTGTSGYGILFAAGYKSLQINGLFTNADVATQIVPSEIRDFGHNYFHLKHEFSPAENWTVTTTYTPSRTIHEIPTDAPGDTVVEPGEFRNTGHLFELTTSGRLTDQIGLVLGAAYETTKTRFPGGDKDRNWWSEVYGQIDYKPIRRLKLVAGLQINKIVDLDEDLSPRAGLIFDLGKGWTSKLLYGQAFRPPRAIETALNKGSNLPAVKPETIETIDLQISYTNRRFETALTYYRTVQSDLQTMTDDVGTSPRVINQGEVIYDGVEWEGKFHLNKSIYLLGNASFQTNEGNDGTEEPSRIPNWMVKTGISYASPRGVTLSLFHSFVSESKPIDEIDADDTTINAESGHYFLLTFNMKLNIGTFFGQESLDNLEFSLYGDNLLDEDIFSTDFPDDVNYPRHSGRGIYGALTLSF